ncbi:MAG: hypothetical protein LBS69_01190 [Prevotellaceae bacterium]|nr:hypothetical protein [Prevotellaceae bacterium]
MRKLSSAQPNCNRFIDRLEMTNKINKKMKKKVLVMAVAVMAIGFTNICKAQNPDERKKSDNGKTPLTSIKETDLDRAGLKGKVYSIRQIEYEAIEKFGEITKGNICYKCGKLIKYDAKGNKIEENRYNKSDGSLRYKYTYKYDAKGNWIETNKYNSDGSLYDKFTYKYDAKGNKIEKNNYNSDGSLFRKYTYKYDAKGNMIEENNYNSDGSLFDKFTNKYDDKGNQIETNGYNSDGSLVSKYTYKYDARGNKIEDNWHKSDGSLVSKDTYKYDAKGNKIEENYYKSDGRLHNKSTYKYRYDSKSNWIEAVIYEGEANKAVSIIEREIEYYE